MLEPRFGGRSCKPTASVGWKEPTLTGGARVGLVQVARDSLVSIDLQVRSP